MPLGILGHDGHPPPRLTQAATGQVLALPWPAFAPLHTQRQGTLTDNLAALVDDGTPSLTKRTRMRGPLAAALRQVFVEGVRADDANANVMCMNEVVSHAVEHVTTCLGDTALVSTLECFLGLLRTVDLIERERLAGDASLDDIIEGLLRPALSQQRMILMAAGAGQTRTEGHTVYVGLLPQHNGKTWVAVFNRGDGSWHHPVTAAFCIAPFLALAPTDRLMEGPGKARLHELLDLWEPAAEHNMEGFYAALAAWNTDSGGGVIADAHGVDGKLHLTGQARQTANGCTVSGLDAALLFTLCGAFGALSSQPLDLVPMATGYHRLVWRMVRQTLARKLQEDIAQAHGDQDGPGAAALAEVARMV